jgi:DNA uptake protein ComE-like DNA-binding protein
MALPDRPKWLNPRRRALEAKILNDPYYRCQSLAEVAIAAELGLKIDVNRASVDDWLRLPGISIHQARTLVELVGMGMQLLSLEDVAAAIGIPASRLAPLAPALHFCYYDTDSALAPQRVNPNTATWEQLAQIPLLEPSLAQSIVRERQAQGSFRNLADLQLRLALDSQFVAQLMHYLQVS